YTDPSGFRSDDRKTVCVDGCYQSGAGLEEVVVTGQRQSSRPQLQGNLAAGSLAGTGGGSHPPSSTIGDQLGPAGNPVAEDDDDKDDEECTHGGEACIRAELNPPDSSDLNGNFYRWWNDLQ